MPTESHTVKPDDLIAFEVKPRLLTLLGDQLIRDANLAVFELVKNAYDADATKCLVDLKYLGDPDKERIVIRDDGCGMDAHLLKTVWMVIATDFRTNQRLHNARSPVFNRYPLGEKGLGRLSIHKLGRYIKLVTRVKDGDELVMEFDWDKLETSQSLNEASVKLTRRDPKTFPNENHGTCLIVSRLRETWSRGQVRRLHRAVNALCSPYKGPSDFEVILSTPGNESWLEGLFTAEQAYESAIYHVEGYFQDSTAHFCYEFNPPQSSEKQLRARVERDIEIQLQKKIAPRKSAPLSLTEHGIGKVEFDFWIYDRDPTVLRAISGDVKGLKDYLDDNGGIRIYRDGIRVYDFGEPGNDWLNLDSRRINTPTAKTSNNQILGILRLDARSSKDLREKSNREGFIETPAYADFREAVLSLLTHVEAEKSKDQRRLRESLGKGTSSKLFASLNELREILEQKGVLAEVEPKIKAIEKEMETYRDQLLHAAVPGLTIGIMLHGAEKILEELKEASRKNSSSEKISQLIEMLYKSMRPITNLLKNPGLAKVSARNLIKEALFSTELRLKRHGVELICELNGDSYDFKITGSKQMLIASITNLIDNSLYWLDIKDSSPKLIYIGISTDIEGGPAIIVADNGPGFGIDNAEDLTTPFFTRRSGGMGLGLYIVDEVMRVNKGRIVFPDKGDIGLPDEIDGAIVGLQFMETE